MKSHGIPQAKPRHCWVMQTAYTESYWRRVSVSLTEQVPDLSPGQKVALKLVRLEDGVAAWSGKQGTSAWP